MSVAVTPADPHLQYMGRIDITKPECPVFYYAGSYVAMAFTGDFLAVTLQNHRAYHENWIGYFLDGVEGRLALAGDDTPQTLEIPVPAGRKQHELILFKRQDGCHYFRLLGFLLADGACTKLLPPLPARRMECYGDSISAGIRCELYDAVGQSDPPDCCDGSADNAWYAFSMQTARILGAQIHNVAQGGIALLDHTGYFCDGEIGMESVYDKLCYLPYADTGMTKWNFSRYTPQVVLFAVGQNDHRIGATEDHRRTGFARDIWKSGYKEILRDLLGRYPKATFVLTLTLIQHDSDWEAMLDEVCEELAQPRVLRFHFRRGGQATPGHPRVQEQSEMASELAQFLTALGPSLWG